jgi:MFS family permease
LPIFFQKVYPFFKAEYGLYNALIVAGMGFTSTIVGGLLSDKFEKKSRMTKARICMIGSALGMPAILACTLLTNNFYLSMFAMALKYLVSECWMSPAITMMQATVKPEEQGSIVSAHLFYLTIAGCFSTVLLGQVANMLGAAANPAIYGKLISLWSVIGYVGSIPCFWKAGKLYKDKMDQLEQEAQ